MQDGRVGIGETDPGVPERWRRVTITAVGGKLLELVRVDEEFPGSLHWTGAGAAPPTALVGAGPTRWSR